MTATVAAREEDRIAAEVNTIIPQRAGGGPSPEYQDLGQKIYMLVVEEIGRERGRCVDLVLEVAESAAKSSRRAKSAEHAATIGGNARAAQGAAAVASQADVLHRALVAVSNVLGLAPGTCKSCGGTKLVRSQLNPAHMVPCAPCAAPVAVKIAGERS